MTLENVVSGELIEASWGNAVVDAIDHSARGLLAIGVGPTIDIPGIGAGANAVSGLEVTFAEEAGRAYRVLISLCAGSPTVDTTANVSIVDAGAVSHAGASEAVHIGDLRTLVVQDVYVAVSDNASAYRRGALGFAAGTGSYVGTFNRRAVITVEDLGRP